MVTLWAFAMAFTLLVFTLAMCLTFNPAGGSFF